MTASSGFSAAAPDGSASPPSGVACSPHTDSNSGHAQPRGALVQQSPESSFIACGCTPYLNGSYRPSNCIRVKDRQQHDYSFLTRPLPTVLSVVWRMVIATVQINIRAADFPVRSDLSTIPNRI